MSAGFENVQIDVNQLPSSAEVLYEKPDLTYKKVMVSFVVIVAIIILSIYILIGQFVNILLQYPWILIFSICWLVLSGLFVILAIKSYEYEGYAIRDKDIIYKSGIFFRQTLILPFNRVQHCEIEHGPIDRIFGLAQLSLFTAGGSGSDMTIPGLNQEVATKLKNFITNRVAVDDEE
jgi:membrane protein YdbS with pleckstrin-like domain